MDLPLTPSPTRDRALARGLGALLLLGAHHAAFEYRPAFALWSVGRPSALALLPAATLFALHGLALAMLLTRHPRASAALACALIAALYAAVPATYHNNHYLLFLALLLVAIAPTSTAAPIGLARALRAQLSLVYLASVAVKLAHPWWRGSGSVVRWLATTRAPESNPGALLPRLLTPLLAAPLPSRLADLAVMSVEAALPFALAWPRTRRAAVVVGVALHLTMQEWLFPQLFTFLMLLGYFAWSPADDRAWALTVADARAARLAAALDPLHRLAVSVDPSAATSLIAPDGRRFVGWRVAPWIATLTPHTVLVYAAVALLFPELTALGPVARDALENLLVAAFLTALALSSTRAVGVPGRESSHPQ